MCEKGFTIAGNMRTHSTIYSQEGFEGQKKDNSEGPNSPAYWKKVEKIGWLEHYGRWRFKGVEEKKNGEAVPKGCELCFRPARSFS